MNFMKIISSFNLFIILFNNHFGYWQIGKETISYKRSYVANKLFPSIVQITFYPDSTYLREDYLVKSKDQLKWRDQTYKMLIPEKEYGKWRLNKRTIIINWDKGQKNAFYCKYKLKRKSIKFIPNQDRIGVGAIRYK
jgi:hypothetical protein